MNSEMIEVRFRSVYVLAYLAAQAVVELIEGAPQCEQERWNRGP